MTETTLINYQTIFLSSQMINVCSGCSGCNQTHIQMRQSTDTGYIVNRSTMPLQHYCIILPPSQSASHLGRNPPHIFWCSLRVFGYTVGVSVVQRLWRRTSGLVVMGSIPSPGVVRHLGQLSLPSLRGR